MKVLTIAYKKKKEVKIIIYAKNVSKGTLNSTAIHARKVFKRAIKEGAHSIILCHNHPSGNSKPSPEDLVATKQLIKVGELVGIAVVDHVIIGKETWWSWKEEK